VRWRPAQAHHRPFFLHLPGGTDIDTTATSDTMRDLLVAAFRCDLVRSATFMLGNAGSNRAWNAVIGVVATGE
jgi:hypothetical protein